MKRSLEEMGPRRTAKTLLRLNQAEGFDCPSCAWPDPEVGHRHTAEFCENGAKAVSEEATKTRATPEFFARHSIAELDAQTEHWLGQQGRITHPMVEAARARATTRRSPGTPRSAIIADELNALAEPGRGPLLHLRSDLQRGRVRLPAVHPGVRHQQPARLLQHVPRVDVGGAGRDDRHRQGQREPGGRARGVAAGAGRAEPGHQPPADAVGAGGGQGSRGQDHRHQPAARGRAWSTSATRSGPAASSARAPTWPTCTCRSRSTATSRCSRRSARCWSSGTRSTTTSSTPTRTGSRPGASTSAPSTGPRSRPRPGCPGSRSPRPPG